MTFGAQVGWLFLRILATPAGQARGSVRIAGTEETTGRLRHGRGRIVASNLLTQDRCIIPGKIQFRVRCVAGQLLQRRCPAVFVIKKDITLLALNECNHVNVLVLSHDRIPLVKGWPSGWLPSRGSCVNGTAAPLIRSSGKRPNQHIDRTTASLRWLLVQPVLGPFAATVAPQNNLGRPQVGRSGRYKAAACPQGQQQCSRSMPTKQRVKAKGCWRSAGRLVAATVVVHSPRSACFEIAQVGGLKKASRLAERSPPASVSPSARCALIILELPADPRRQIKIVGDQQAAQKQATIQLVYRR